MNTGRSLRHRTSRTYLLRLATKIIIIGFKTRDSQFSVSNTTLKYFLLLSRNKN